MVLNVLKPRLAIARAFKREKCFNYIRLLNKSSSILQCTLYHGNDDGEKLSFKEGHHL